MSEQYLSIREMCEAYDVTPRTLRFYESKELLFPVRQGTRRLFTRKDRARLKLILRGKRFGFSLEDIRQLLNLYDPSQLNLPQMVTCYDMAQERLRDMEQQRDELNEAIEELKGQLEWGADLIETTRKGDKAAAE